MQSEVYLSIPLPFPLAHVNLLSERGCWVECCEVSHIIISVITSRCSLERPAGLFKVKLFVLANGF